MFSVPSEVLTFCADSVILLSHCSIRSFCPSVVPYKSACTLVEVLLETVGKKAHTMLRLPQIKRTQAEREQPDHVT